MSTRSIVVAAAALAAALAAPSCANTVCTEGWYSCDEEIARRCVGPAEGGDEDGELVDVRDCGAEGLVCLADVYDGPDGEIRTAGCTTASCRSGAQGIPCLEEGTTTCSLNAVRTCAATAEADCFAWDTTADCTATAETCSYAGDQAGCAP